MKRQSCQLVFDCLQDNVSSPFKGYFTKIEHNINTRNNGCSLKLPKAKLEKISRKDPILHNEVCNNSTG